MLKHVSRIVLLAVIFVCLGMGTVTIWAKAPEAVKITARDSNAKRRQYTIYWNKVKDISGYEIQVYDAANKRIISKRVGRLRKKYTLSKIQEGQLYRVRIRTYTRTEDKTTGEDVLEYGRYTSIYIAQQSKVSFAWVNTKSCRATWNAVNGATSYTVYMSNRRGVGYKKVKTVRTNRLKLKYLKQNTKYYVYVVANYKVGDVTYRTPVSRTYAFSLSGE